jgi:hypothetical protein
MIPKRMTFCWGNETLPFLRWMTLYSFRKFHPNWEIKFIKFNAAQKQWRTPERHNVMMAGRDCMGCVKELGISDEYSMLSDGEYSCAHFKDLYSWMVLAHEGGFVADMDILFFQSIERHIDLSADVMLICYEGNPDPGYIPVTLMGGSANRFFMDTLRKAKSNYDPIVYQSCGTLAIGFNNLSAIQIAYPELKIRQMQDGIINPFFPQYDGHTALLKIFRDNARHEFNPDCVAIHWFGNNSAIPEDEMQRCCSESIQSSDTTIGVVVREVMDAGLHI